MFNKAWGQALELWLYKIYYGFPGVPFHLKRALIRYIHRRLSTFTRGTISYTLNEISKVETAAKHDLWDDPVFLRRIDYTSWSRRYENISTINTIYRMFLTHRFRNQMLITVVPSKAQCDVEDTINSIKNSLVNSRLKARIASWQEFLECLKKGSGDEWIVLVRSGSEIRENTFFHIVRHLYKTRDTELLYGDQDYLNEEGRREHPYFKPDWNLEAAISHDLIGPLLIARKNLLIKLKIAPDDSLYGIGLKASQNTKRDQIVHIPYILSTEVTQLEYDLLTGRAELIASILRNRGEGIVIESPQLGKRSPCVRFRSQVTNELVSIIIPTRNGLGYLKRCIDSILQCTEQDNYEIIVLDNGSDEEETQKFLSKLTDYCGAKTAQVVEDNAPFNFSRLNNHGVERANGNILCLMNNDIEVIESGWLREMSTLANRKGIGAVGAMLIYPNGKLQHAGVFVGIGGAAGHLLRFWDPAKADHLGPPGLGRIHMLQEVSAVTAACLVIRKERYLEVGGLDEDNFAVAFNDVDLCLKLRQAGYRNLYTPYARFIHHESVSRGDDALDPAKARRYMKELRALQNKWHTMNYLDPFYNPNLCSYSELGMYSFPPRS